MQGSKASSVNVSNTSQKYNFLQGIRNAQYLLNKLDRSIQKTNKYETRLLQCKATHAHTHTNDKYDQSQVERSELRESTSVTENPSGSSSRNPIDLANSWSTMSIVCLQYQYEELSKRYESLLRAYDERCNASNVRDTSAQRLRERLSIALEQLTNTHQALLAIGEKYLNLRHKMLSQKCCYEDKVQRLLEELRRMMLESERARIELDERLARCLSCEHDTAIALLLAEIKKCNLLFLENMRLKVEIEELTCKPHNFALSR